MDTDDEDSTPETTTRLAWDPYRETYVAQSPARMHRRELAAECPFCADRTSGRIPADVQAWIRPNDFPALTPPAGECYVLVYSPDHERSFADLSVDEAVAVVALWQEMYRRLAPRYACVMTWETSGAAIGQTQRHPHGQTYGVSFLPEMLRQELAAIERAEAGGQGCPLCAELRAEEPGPRAVVSGEHWVGFVPAFARYPYQVRLVPRRHFSAIVDVGGDDAARELAVSLLRLVRACSRLFQAPMPYMLALHQLGDPRFHLHLELLPVGGIPGKLKLAASSEIAWGLWLNDALPEHAAAQLRTAMEQE